jgi:5'-nucleotidase/UDP-sugar diphosphatase
MAARKTLLDDLKLEIKNENGHYILLSGGDINTGTMESDIFDAEPDFKGMNLLGYDAMAVGNHEFDNSYKTLLKQQKWAGFPFLSANIFWKGTKKRVFNPAYIIKNYGDLKVGIFGLTTVDTPFKASHDEAKRKFDFRSIIDSAKSVVKELKEKEKVDLIFVVTHVGHY